MIGQIENYLLKISKNLLFFLDLVNFSLGNDVNTELGIVIANIRNYVPTKDRMFTIARKKVVNKRSRVVMNSCWFINCRKKIETL